MENIADCVLIFIAHCAVCNVHLSGWMGVFLYFNRRFLIKQELLFLFLKSAFEYDI